MARLIQPAQLAGRRDGSVTDRGDTCGESGAQDECVGGRAGSCGATEHAHANANVLKLRPNQNLRGSLGDLSERLGRL